MSAQSPEKWKRMEADVKDGLPTGIGSTDSLFYTILIRSVWFCMRSTGVSYDRTTPCGWAQLNFTAQIVIEMKRNIGNGTVHHPCVKALIYYSHGIENRLSHRWWLVWFGTMIWTADGWWWPSMMDLSSQKDVMCDVWDVQSLISVIWQPDWFVRMEQHIPFAVLSHSSALYAERSLIKYRFCFTEMP